jgi:hypothetical protein
MIPVVKYSIRNIKTPEDLNNVISSSPVKNRNKILAFLKSAEDGVIGFTALKDPVTKRVYSTGLICYEKDGYSWNNGVVYLFEKYNIKLNDEFLKHFV